MARYLFRGRCSPGSKPRYARVRRRPRGVGGQPRAAARFLLLPITLISKFNHEYAPPRTVLGHLEEIDESCKPRGPSQLRRDISQRYFEDPGHDDLSRRQRIAPADFDVRSLPQANGRRDLASANAIAERSKE